MRLYKIDTEEYGYELVVAETARKASWLVLEQWEVVTPFGIDDPSFIKRRKLLLKDIDGPARIVDDLTERELIERGAAAIGKHVLWGEVGDDFGYAFYAPADRKCYECGATDDLIWTGDSSWQCTDDDACYEKVMKRLAGQTPRMAGV